MIAPLPSQPPLVLPPRSTFDIRGKSADVIQHHFDPTLPGQPLFFVIPGAVVAVGSIALIIWTLFRTFVTQDLPSATGMPVLIVLAVFYIAGVFLFSYGFERFDLTKAVKETVFIVLLTVLVVVILAALFLVVAALFSGKREGGGGGRSGGSWTAGSNTTRVSQQNAALPSNPIYHATPHYAGPLYTAPIYAPPIYERPTIVMPPASTPQSAAIPPQTVPPKAVPHQVVCRYCHAVSTITGDAFNCPKCGAPNLPGDMTNARGVGLTAGGMPLTTPAAFKAVLNVSELRWIGLQPTLEEPEVNVEPGNGVAASWTSDSGAEGGIELDLYSAADGDPATILNTVVKEGEGDGPPVAAQLAGADESYEAKGDRFAWIAARRGPLVFALSIPTGARASEQLAYLGGLILHRVAAG
jgi:hypothetical protein